MGLYALSTPACLFRVKRAGEHFPSSWMKRKDLSRVRRLLEDEEECEKKPVLMKAKSIQHCDGHFDNCVQLVPLLGDDSDTRPALVYRPHASPELMHRFDHRPESSTGSCKADSLREEARAVACLVCASASACRYAHEYIGSMGAAGECPYAAAILQHRSTDGLKASCPASGSLSAWESLCATIIISMCSASMGIELRAPRFEAEPWALRHEDVEPGVNLTLRIAHIERVSRGVYKSTGVSTPWLGKGSRNPAGNIPLHVSRAVGDAVDDRAAALVAQHFIGEEVHVVSSMHDVADSAKCYVGTDVMVARYAWIACSQWVAHRTGRRILLLAKHASARLPEAGLFRAL
mmetsp:Transcript_14881/g.37111  ORF Transcript_14881/g.37111 Transcript_14881/m.37111 type:complete len:348 (-) Transcript_14881:304-1347(-)